MGKEMNMKSLVVIRLWMGILAPFVLLTFIVLASFVTPDYSQIHHTISRLAAQKQPHPNIMSTGLILFGGMIFLFGISVGRLLPDIHGKLVTTGLAIFGLSVVITGAFKDYPPGFHNQPGNTEGYLHNLFAGISLIGLLMAAFTTSHATCRNPRWYPLGIVTVLMTSTIVLLGTFHLFLSDDYIGIKQKLMMAATCVWLIVFSYKSLSFVKKCPL